MSVSLFTATLPQHGVRAVVFDGGCINAPNEGGDTPLLCALRRRVGLDSIRELVRLGARTDLVSRDGVSPLRLAVQHPNPAVLQLLIDVGADPNAPRHRTSALHAAVHLDLRQSVAMLLDSGADPNHEGERGYLPLFYARSRHGALQLIAGGANPYLRNRGGVSAVEHWQQHGMTQALDALAGPRPALRVVS